MYKNIMIKLFLRSIIVVIIGWGLFISLFSAFGSFQFWQLLYYTNLSNLAVMLLFIYLIIHDLRSIDKQKTVAHSSKNHIPCSTRLKVALTWAISITGIVWHTLLAPFFDQLLLKGGNTIDALPPTFSMTQFILSISLLHTWSPLLVFLDWLIFNPKGKISLYAPLTWLQIPALYLAFICIWVDAVGPVNEHLYINYPYPFIDFSTYPATQICANIGIITIGMTVLGYLYWGIDRLLLKLRNGLK